MRRHAAFAAGLALALLFAAVPALAQEAQPAIRFDGFSATVIEYALATLAVVVTWAIAYGAKKVRDWFGIRADEALRDTLHSAAMTGLRAALDRANTWAAGISINVKSQVLADAANYVLNVGAPQAVERFGLTPQRVAELVQSKLPVVELEEIAAGVPVTGDAPAPRP